MNPDPDRPLKLRLLVTLMGPVLIISGMVSFRLGGGAFLVVIPLGILVGLGSAELLWKTISGTSQALVRTIFSTGGAPPSPPTSRIEALDARGEYSEAGAQRWRYFGTREVQWAKAWAADGGIAVHENLFPSRGRRTAHLLAADEAALVAAAVSVGCGPGWVQRTRTLHFDLVAPMLTRALRRCGIDPAAPPRRSGLSTGSTAP